MRPTGKRSALPTTGNAGIVPISITYFMSCLSGTAIQKRDHRARRATCAWGNDSGKWLRGAHAPTRRELSAIASPGVKPAAKPIRACNNGGDGRIVKPVDAVREQL